MDKKRILVVDDMAISLSAAENALKEFYEVTTMNSGTRALRYLGKETADLILLDIRMDEKDGIETLKEIRKMHNGKDIPVIMLTSAQDRKSVIESSKLGIFDYILKPFDPEDLRKRVENALSSPQGGANNL